MTNFMAAKFQKAVSSKMYCEFKGWGANSVDQDGAAHLELPHLALHCSQNQLQCIYIFGDLELWLQIWASTSLVSCTIW